MIYLKNSLSPFREFKISDIGGTQIIDDIMQPCSIDTNVFDITRSSLLE